MPPPEESRAEGGMPPMPPASEPLAVAEKLPPGTLQREFAEDPDAGVKAMLILMGAKLDSVHDTMHDLRDRLIALESKLEDMARILR